MLTRRGWVFCKSFSGGLPLLETNRLHLQSPVGLSSFGYIASCAPHTHLQQLFFTDVFIIHLPVAVCQQSTFSLLFSSEASVTQSCRWARSHWGGNTLMEILHSNVGEKGRERLCRVTVGSTGRKGCERFVLRKNSALWILDN